MMNKIFAIGDIHGCLDKLQRLIRDMAADPVNDTLVFIGDYIDRAGGGKDVVDYVLRLKKNYQKVICLCGNHESMLLRYLEGVDEDMYLANGGIDDAQCLRDIPVGCPTRKKGKNSRGSSAFF